jgi:hypothetical protein
MPERHISLNHDKLVAFLIEWWQPAEQQKGAATTTASEDASSLDSLIFRCNGSAVCYRR